MRKLLLVPDSESYQSTDGEASIYIALEGGAGRSRLDKIGAAKMVQASWTMNRSQYQYWRAFYRLATMEASLPFLCDMLSEDGTGPAEHTCRFIPGSVNLPRQQGFTYIQQATLEVIPIASDAEADENILLVFETSNGQPEAWYMALERLVNVVMPGTLY